MAQILESTKDFDICGGLNPGTVRVSTANSKAAVISSRCAIFRPATAEFRVITTHQKKAPPTRGWQEKGSAKITSFSNETVFHEFNGI